MGKLKRYIGSLDRRAFFITITLIGCFSGYIYYFHEVENFIFKSHVLLENSDSYCAKKINFETSFCSNRRAESNERWKEMTAGSSDNKRTITAFGLRK